MTHVTDVHNDKILSNDNEDYESVSPAADVTRCLSVLKQLWSTDAIYSGSITMTIQQMNIINHSTVT